MPRMVSLAATAALIIGVTVWAWFSSISPTRSQPALDKVISDAILHSQPVADSGIAIAVIKNGALYYSGGFGFRDRGRSAKVDANTFFGIGSATKAFTSMAISLLAEENMLRTDVPIKQYLPDFAMKDTEATDKMTLADILSHRSGLPRHDALWYLGPFSRSQLFYRLHYLDPIPGAFGTTFYYNSMMYMVAGYLLESRSGNTWEQFIKTRILAALNMPESDFTITELSRRSNYAKGYFKEIELPLKDVENIGPAAEINSSVLEMANWVLLFLNQGRAANGTQIITPADLKRMYDKYVDVTPPAFAPRFCDSETSARASRSRASPGAAAAGSGVSYGWGWFITTIQNKRLVFHPGNTDGYSAYVSFMPDDGLAVVALTSQHAAPNFPQEVAAKIYEYLLNGSVADKLHLPESLPYTDSFGLSETEMHPASTSSPSTSNRSYPRYTGMFSDMGYGDISVGLSGDVLYISHYQRSWPLHQSSDGFYFCMPAFGFNFRVPVVFNETNGAIDSLSIPFQPRLPTGFIKR